MNKKGRLNCLSLAMATETRSFILRPSCSEFFLKKDSITFTSVRDRNFSVAWIRVPAIQRYL